MTKPGLTQGGSSIIKIFIILPRGLGFSLVLLVMNLVLVIQPPCLRAESMDVPIHLPYPFLHQILIRHVFNGPGNAAEFHLDADGCTKIVFVEPILSGSGNSMRLVCQVRSAIGVMSIRGCASHDAWVGKAELLAHPVLRSGSPSAVYFALDDLILVNKKGQRLTGGIIWESTRECLEDLLGHFKVDFGPSLSEIKVLLPMILPRHTSDQMKKAIHSLRLVRVAALPDGLKVQMNLDVDTVPAKSSVLEPPLNPEEIKQWEKQWESWDAYITFVVKRMAMEAELATLRATLLDILLESRYELRDALSSDATHETDTVRIHFIRSWRRLSPVLQEISGSFPGKESLAVLAFLTACNTLQALDNLGPAVGLEISTNGLRRLARLVSDSPGIDPLRYGEEEDPELRRLFGFTPSMEEGKDPGALKLNFRLIRRAYAGTPPQPSLSRLNEWVPTPGELDQYLPLVRKLLDKKADSLLKDVNITPKAISVFKNLVLAAAWQESCWRQYVVEGRKLVPLRSDTGDVGLMQINERVWRGFYSHQKLRWDIGYNAKAGGEILLKYMVDYAIPKGEHKKGDIHNLARASYSAYNGGPSKLSRYRSLKASKEQKKIDTLFWEKYKAVQQGNEFEVAKCFGGTAIASPSDSAGRNNKVSMKKSKAAQPGPPPRSSGPAELKSESWILAQNPKHFTLQLAVLGSEQNFRAFIHKQKDPDRVAYYRMKRDDRKLYAVIYGTFANQREAEKAARSLKFDKPWVRDFLSLQAIIKKQ
jgi:hypothetical protein